MKYFDFCVLVTELQKQSKFRETYTENADPRYVELETENAYVTSLNNAYKDTLRALFKDLYWDITWFLDEWHPGFAITVNDKKYDIDTLQDYLDYARAELFDKEGNLLL